MGMLFVKLYGDIMSRTDLTPLAKIVYSYIANSLGGNDAARPTTRQVAEACGADRHSVSRVVNELVEAGLLEVEKGGFHRPNTYRLPRELGTEPTQLLIEGMGTEYAHSAPKPMGTEYAHSAPKPMGTEYAHSAPKPMGTKHAHSWNKKRPIEGTKCAHLKIKTIKKTIAQSAAPTERKPRPRNPLWDVICELWSLKPVTKSDQSRVGKLARDFALKGADPVELRARKERYSKAWPDAECSPEAVLKHWDRFAEDDGPKMKSADEWVRD